MRGLNGGVAFALDDQTPVWAGSILHHPEYPPFLIVPGFEQHPTTEGLVRLHKVSMDGHRAKFIDKKAEPMGDVVVHISDLREVVFEPKSVKKPAIMMCSPKPLKNDVTVYTAVQLVDAVNDWIAFNVINIETRVHYETQEGEIWVNAKWGSHPPEHFKIKRKKMKKLGEIHKRLEEEFKAISQKFMANHFWTPRGRKHVK